MQIENLKAPFPPEEIDWRVGSVTQDKKKGMALAYIDARVVMERLDNVCGVENWQCRYTAVGDKTCCEIGIKVLDCDATDDDHNELCKEWVWKSDGAGDTDFEGAKGAFSDALKRAAVRWGIGRYLYDLKAPWVAIEQRGKSYVIAPHEIPRLRALLPNFDPKAPPPDRPELPGRQNTVELKSNIKAFAEQLGSSEIQTPEQLEDLLLTFHDTIEEAKKELSSWWETGDGMPEEFVPLKQRIEAKRRFLAGAANLGAG